MLSKEARIRWVNVFHVIKGLLAGVQAAGLMLLLNFILFMVNDMAFGNSGFIGFVGGVIIAVCVLRNLRGISDELNASKEAKIKKILEQN